LISLQNIGRNDARVLRGFFVLISDNADSWGRVWAEGDSFDGRRLVPD